MPSPDKERVRQQPALEALPCILEPESRFYTSPVAVLDFRSLYPSVIIAYNFCYSTCLGPARAIIARLDAQGLPRAWGARDDVTARLSEIFQAGSAP